MKAICVCGALDEPTPEQQQVQEEKLAGPSCGHPIAAEVAKLEKIATIMSC